MYNSSRGILYTAPPGPDETDENRSEGDVTATNTSTDPEEAVLSAESTESLAADD
ncbi:hypothetical protein [Natronorubrum tibetense]|uniref:hypothetical protein n=1 Tax=Natronorubrum tibetense TaxID=63128 RepID=UPI00037A1A13|nr:hypothetical protein [Natronorubrum tibetense]